MALLFPLSASIGQTYQTGSSNTYEWTGTYWKIKNVINFNDFSASIVDRIITATNEGQFATTGSNHFYGNQTITGNISANNFSADDSNVTISSNFSPNRIALEAYNGAKILLSTNEQGEIDITSPNIKITGDVNISGSLIPTTADGTYTSSFSLGSATNAWKDLYISHGSIIFVDSLTQATSSFSISTDADAGENTVQYTAGITASYYLGDGRGLTNLPSTTNWNKDKQYILRNTEQLTFSGDYMLENSLLAIEGGSNNSIGEWANVTENSISGLITKTGNNTYRIDGPNDNSNSSGWVFIKRYFDTPTTMSIGYEWIGSDGNNDWPMYEVNPTEQTGEMDNANRLQDTGGPEYENGTWEINVPAQNWLAIGVFSNDSCCGSGSLNITLPYILNEDVQYSTNKYFKKEGTIFIGGNLLLKDSTIINNGKISVGGEVILIGNSQIQGTGTII